jgi:glycosyltransferase involved in cell wall biosynthesis
LKQLYIGILGTRGIPNHYGGFEQFAQYLSAGLVQKGHSVAVYCSHTHPFQEESWNGVQLIHCTDPVQRYGTAGQFLYDRNCNRDSQHRNFDIILHLGYTSDSIWYKKWAAGAIHIVNMDGLEWKRSKYNLLTRIFLKKAEALAAKHADWLVADSTAIQQYLQTKYQREAAFIPYGATIFSNPDVTVLTAYDVKPGAYCLAIARMEPENNIEMIIKGYLASAVTFPLLLVGDTGTRYGKYLHSTYTDPRIRFTGGMFDEIALNQLRYYSLLYFHGHSAGGTNPSLLEAMACGCHVIAHDNEFNKAVTGTAAGYFKDPAALTRLLNEPLSAIEAESRKLANIERIRNSYSHAQIISQYESLMLEAVLKRS